MRVQRRHNLLIVFAPIEGTKARLASILERIAATFHGARIAFIVSGRDSAASPESARRQPSRAGKEAIRTAREPAVSARSGSTARGAGRSRARA